MQYICKTDQIQNPLKVMRESSTTCFIHRVSPEMTWQLDEMTFEGSFKLTFPILQTKRHLEPICYKFCCREWSYQFGIRCSVPCWGKGRGDARWDQLSHTGRGAQQDATALFVFLFQMLTSPMESHCLAATAQPWKPAENKTEPLRRKPHKWPLQQSEQRFALASLLPSYHLHYMHTVVPPFCAIVPPS